MHVAVADLRVCSAQLTFCCLWRREFRLSDDMYAQDSIELLKQSGIDFAQNETRGIDVRHFGELLTVSGVVLNEDVSAVCFVACTPG